MTSTPGRKAYQQGLTFTNTDPRSTPVAAASASGDQPPWHPGPPPDMDSQPTPDRDFSDIPEPPWWVFVIIRTLPPILHTLRGKITMPYDRVALLMQCGAFHGPFAKFTAVGPTLRSIRQTQGLRSLWRGLDGDLLQAVPSSIYRTFLSIGMRIIPAAIIGPGIVDSLISSVPELFVMGLELAVGAAFYPVHSSVTRYQLEFPETSSTSTLDRAKRTFNEEGIAGLYRGIAPYMCGIVLGGFAWTITMRPLKFFLSEILKLPPAAGYLSFHLLATPIVVGVAYPANTISKMQMFFPQKTITECAKELYAKPGGWRNFYRGYWPYCASVAVNHFTTAFFYLLFTDATKYYAEEMMRLQEEQEPMPEDEQS